MGRRKLFCEYGPVCYRIALKKEALRRRWWDAREHTRFALETSAESLPAVVKGHRSPMLRRLHGVDMSLQENKRSNMARRCPVWTGFWWRRGRPSPSGGWWGRPPPGGAIRTG